MGKGVFNCLLYCRSIYRAGQELSRVIETKCIYLATTCQPKLIALYQVTYCQVM